MKVYVVHSEDGELGVFDDLNIMETVLNKWIAETGINEEMLNDRFFYIEEVVLNKAPIDQEKVGKMVDFTVNVAMPSISFKKGKK